MDKSIHSDSYQIAIAMLREKREEAGITQVELARRLAETQTFISKCERGERRLDIIEVRAFCKAVEIDFICFVELLEAKLN